MEKKLIIKLEQYQKDQRLTTDFDLEIGRLSSMIEFEQKSFDEIRNRNLN